jgi:branched-chain amino acid transport system ATP-binding protein
MIQMPPPILALEKISKRFGAVVVAQDIDLALGEGEALGIIGPNGAGKTTLFGIATGAVAPDGGRVLLGGADVTRLPPDRRCRLGLARSFQIPQPFGGMTVFENTVVAAAFGQGRREHDVYASCLDILDRCGLAGKANRVAGGLTEHECASLVTLIREVRATGVSLIWIEHVVHALIAVVDRISVLHAGAIIASGDPNAVIRSPQVAEIYLGIAADA